MVGSSLQDAQAALLPLNSVQAAEAFDSTIAAGTVISQSPAAGAEVAADTVVELTVSLGDAPLTVANVVDTPVADAIQALLPLSAEQVGEVFDNTIAAGNVISQLPAAGAEVTADTVVQLTVSLGDAPLTVANVVDTPVADAIQALLPLIAQQVAESFDDTIAAGNVLLQSPGAGAEVAPDTIIELIVSLGPEPQTPFVTRIRVSEPDGSPVSGATVSDAGTGALYGVTNNSGNVEFALSSPTAETIFRLTADGYADQISPLTIVDGAGSAALGITMVQRTVTTTTFTAGVYSASRSDVVVEWRRASFVSPDGNVVDDNDIEVFYSTVDVSNRAELEAFPGSFTGTQLDGRSTSIASLGTSEYVFVSAVDGAELQLAPQATAFITLPLYVNVRPDTGELINEGDQLPIWSLNEVTGEWLLEEQGEVVMSNSAPTGMAVEAEVSHFSWWNIDVPIATGTVTVQVSGAGVDGSVSVIATPSDIAFRTGYGSVPVGGSYTTVIPAGSEYCFSGTIRSTSGQSASSNTVCTTVAAGSSQTISLILNGVDDPLDITSDLPVDNSGSVTINGFVGVPVQRIRFNATTFESVVNYTAINTPLGVNLSTTSGVAAEIAGIPTSSGSFSVVVTGANADGETDSVIVQYEISGDAAPTQNISITMFGSFEQNRVNLNEVISPPADSWELIGPDPLPVGLNFDEATGEFMIPFSFLFNFPPEYWDWTGLIKATFPGGGVVDYNVTFIFQ